MTQIPSFINCMYKVSEGNLKFNKKKIGIYLISGNSECIYNSTFDHDFTPLKNLKRIWITSYELGSLINHGCIKNLKIHAGIFIISTIKNNPLADYANFYYNLKKITPKDSAEYPFYKITMLNSLYGKFIERRYSDETNYSIRGPNYNPAIASLITGFTRSQLHDMEHKGNALHSATDSVFTFQKMDTSKELGGISLEGFGRLELIRTKCYMFYQKQKPKDKEIIKGKNDYLLKYATHGFHGGIHQLRYLWNNDGKPKREKFKGITLKKNEYKYKKMPTSTEVFIRKKTKLKLFGMNDMKMKLNVDWRNKEGPIY